LKGLKNYVVAFINSTVCSAILVTCEQLISFYIIFKLC